METKVEDKQRYLLVEVASNRLDVAVAPEFKQRIADIPLAERKVILDLSKVPFVDSTGLGALLSLLRQIAQNKGALRIAGLTEQVKSMFMLVRMNKVFDIYDSVSEAERGW